MAGSSQGALEGWTAANDGWTAANDGWTAANSARGPAEPGRVRRAGHVSCNCGIRRTLLARFVADSCMKCSELPGSPLEREPLSRDLARSGAEL